LFGIILITLLSVYNETKEKKIHQI
jgi:hypothetical protein